MDVINIAHGDVLGHTKTAVRASDTRLSVDWLPGKRSVSDMLLVHEYLPGQVTVEAVGAVSLGESPVVMRAIHKTNALAFPVGTEVRAMKSVAWRVKR